MATWTFLRHGESTANAGGWLSGHQDVPLTDRGLTQAHGARDQLADHVFAQAWTSDLQRAHHTARVVLADRDHPPLQVDPLLRERSLGTWEGRDKAQLRADGSMDQLLTWTGAPPQGESHRDLAQRAVPFLASIDQGIDTLIVAHGGLIRVLIGLLDGLPEDEIGRIAYANCVPHHREIAQGSWSALSWR